MPCNDIVFCRLWEALKATSNFTNVECNKVGKLVLHYTESKSMNNLQWKCILNANNQTYLFAIGLPSNANSVINA
jgi:hypothetical protein